MTNENRSQNLSANTEIVDRCQVHSDITRINDQLPPKIFMEWLVKVFKRANVSNMGDAQQPCDG